MITAIIITFFIGTLTGYVVAALMAVSSNTEREKKNRRGQQNSRQYLKPRKRS